jgi:hypothetical protein
MKRLRLRRPSPAFVLAMIALIVALGGTAYALGRNTVGTKQVKNNSLTGKDIKEKKVGPVDGAVKFNKGANEGSTVVLAKNKRFAVVGNCDEGDAVTPSGFQQPGTWIGIRNRGQDNGYADTTDDDDADFDIGDGVAFNYQDGGDEGEAILRNGHWIAVEGSIDFQSSDTTQFSTDCRFAGYAEFN